MRAGKGARPQLVSTLRGVGAPGRRRPLLEKPQAADCLVARLDMTGRHCLLGFRSDIGRGQPLSLLVSQQRGMMVLKVSAERASRIVLPGNAPDCVVTVWTVMELYGHWSLPIRLLMCR